jgi:hypothetical protein
MSHTSDLPVSVDCTTTEGTAGDETSGDDYQFAAGTLTLAPGETSATLTLVINPDGAEEPDEWFFVDLSAGEPAGAVTIDESRATVTVEDDDDLGPPVVVAVSVAPAGEVAECSKVGVPVLELTALSTRRCSILREMPRRATSPILPTTSCWQAARISTSRRRAVPVDRRVTTSPCRSSP